MRFQSQSYRPPPPFKPYYYVLLFVLTVATSAAYYFCWLSVDDAYYDSSSSGTAPRITTIPNFLLIGVQKSGTTYIANHLLRLRRQVVCGPQSRDPYHFEKEAHFFDQSDQMALGAHAYASLFHHCHRDARVLMDATPAYQLYPERVRTVYEELLGTTTAAALDDVKLLITLREPVQRDMAWYNYLIHHAMDPYPPQLAHTVIKNTSQTKNSSTITFKTFEEYAQDYLFSNLKIRNDNTSNNATEPQSQQQPHRGLYAYWLQRWVDAGFRRDQLWVVSYDHELVVQQNANNKHHDPRVFLNRLHTFLHLPTTRKRSKPLRPDNTKGASAAIPCTVQEQLARAYQRPNEELYQWLDAHPGPAVEQRPFPKFHWSCNDGAQHD